MEFDGQQTDEKILHTIVPHAISLILRVGQSIAGGLLFLFVAVMISTVLSAFSVVIIVAGVLLAIVIAIGGIAWSLFSYKNSKTYITDRRIIRFDRVNPLLVTKRSLFWNEVLKAKGYSPGFFMRLLGIGALQIEPQTTLGEDVHVPFVTLYEDLANYIDKILFTYKNQPSGVPSIKPFVPKPKGKRDS
ncbi:hypothetical protein HY947_01420 [Candidatus Gottesmanbacteria bacterium]|nr:hypothetical protein [Candidatus Gottesmanbacteria bacterium]